MDRAVIIVRNDRDRVRAAEWCRRACDGARIEFRLERRSLEQNAAMWAMLSDISVQKKHCGRSYSPDEWKVIFLAALGREMQFIPSLDGKTFLPLGMRSSDLSKKEMSDLITFIETWAKENGVVLQAQERAA